jgi:hypothetical protein
VIEKRMNYFISIKGKKKGPYSLEQIKELKLFNDTLAWKEGMENWLEAKEISELKEITFTPPPPLPKKRITGAKIAKVFLAHLFFGFGFYYVDKSVSRKFIYPIFGLYALVDPILASLNIKPFKSDEFGFTTFIISLTICYLIGYIDVFYHLYKTHTGNIKE